MFEKIVINRRTRNAAAAVRNEHVLHDDTTMSEPYYKDKRKYISFQQIVLIYNKRICIFIHARK